METITRQAEAIRLESRTQLGELRELLKRIESRIGTLAYNNQPSEVLAIPDLMDRAALLLEELADQGIDTSGELNRFDAAKAELKHKGASFLRRIGGIPALEQARQARQAQVDNWWWYIDRVEAERKKTGVRRLLKAGAIGLLILATVATIYQLFLAPPPEIRASYEQNLLAENWAAEGDFSQALAHVELALEYTPDNAELLVMQGVFEILLGQDEAAEESFAAAQAAYNNPTQFLLKRSTLYLMCEQVNSALDDVEAALAIDPQSAKAYLLRGQGYEALENYQQAKLSYEQADELAGQTGDYELQAVVRMRMAQLVYKLAAPTPIQTTLP
jgi:Flp pilus assembly protein TadD